MLLVSECVARAALEREESRGGHTRDDFPEMDPQWRQVNLICSTDGDGVEVEHQPLPTMPTELLGLFDRCRAEQVPDRRGARPLLDAPTTDGAEGH